MNQDTLQSARQGRTLLFLIGLLGVVLCVYVAYYLAFGIRQEIDNLATANSDNIQWSLAQNEVEILQFINKARKTQESPALIGELKQSFDVFYSRMVTLQTSGQLATLRRVPEVKNRLKLAEGFIDRNAAIFDLPDPQIIAKLPTVIRESENIQRELRAISISGIKSFSESADTRRTQAVEALRRSTKLGTILVLEMSALIYALVKMLRQSRLQTRDQVALLARLETIVATSLDAIIVMDSDGRVLDYNGAAERIFGYERQEAVGQRLSDLFIPDHHRRAHDQALRQHWPKKPSKVIGKDRIRMEGMRKDGSIFPVELSVTAAESTDGEIFVSYLRDISAEIQAEQELVTARDQALQGAKAKAEFLAVMSHEMRTPLNGMLGTLELLKQTRMTAEQRRFLSIIQTSGDLLLHHVTDVLDISRLDAGKLAASLSPFNLPELLKTIVENQQQLASANGNTLSFEILGGGLDQVMGDEKRLMQILLNLVGNAVKFTRDGKVQVQVQRTDGEGVEFRVIDTGVGISPEDQARIFDDFVTIDASYMRSTGGTGLGLGIVKRLVQALGGEIGLHSTPGQGSTFWFRVNLAQAQPAQTPAKRPSRRKAAAVQGAGRRVLIVEDNSINRLVVGEMLRQMGFSVDEAHDGQQGVDLAAKTVYDLVLMDISMPGMDGLTAVGHIRSDGRSASNQSPIVALTAHALPEEMVRFEQAGMATTLTKPISIQRLEQVLSQILGQQKVSKPRATRRKGPAYVDRQTLMQMQDSLGPQAFAKFLGRFLSQTGEELAQLVPALADELQTDANAALAHRLAGSAAVFGAVVLNRNLVDIEKALKTGQRQEIAALAQALPANWAETHAHLSKLSEDGIKATTVIS